MVTGMKNVVVFVRDYDRAKEFYLERLKLPVVREAPPFMEFFPGGGPTLGVSLAMHEAAHPLVGRHTGITLQVAGIEEFCAGLAAAGITFAEPLEKTPWGKMAVVQDPDGNQFALVE